MPDSSVPNRIEAVEAGGYSVEEQRYARGADSAVVSPLRFSVRALLIATAGLAIVIGAFSIAYEIGKRHELERRVLNSFKQIELGLLYFEDARRRRVPTALTDSNGVEISSWRWQVAPYIEQLPIGIARDFKAPWDAPINKFFRSSSFDVYCWTSDDSYDTNVFAITGPDTAFTNNSASANPSLPSDVVLLMDIADSNTHWMQPGDYDVTELLAATGRLGDTVKGLLKDRIHLLFADGEVWALSSDAPIDALKPFLTIPAAKTADRDQQLAPYRVD